MMTAQRILPILVSSLISSPIHAQAQQPERYTLSGREVAFYDLVGHARIEAGTGNEVVIEITRRGRDAARLRVEQGTIAGLSTLRVIFPADDIIALDLTRGSNSTLQVSEDGTWNLNRDGRRVRIRSRERGRDGFEASADLLVRVPAGVKLNGNIGVGTMSATGTRDDLELRTMSGDIEVASASGQLELHTASGNVRLSDTDGNAEVHTASGNVDLARVRGTRLEVNVASGDVTATDISNATARLESASGSIRVRGARGESLRAESASGSVNVQDAQVAELRASTASGTVNVAIDSPIQRADISSASGSVTLAIGPGADATIDAESSSGDIDIDGAIQILSQRRNSLRARIGNGSGRISLDAASGDVRITRLR